MQYLAGEARWKARQNRAATAARPASGIDGPARGTRAAERVKNRKKSKFKHTEIAKDKTPSSRSSNGYAGSALQKRPYRARLQI